MIIRDEPSLTRGSTRFSAQDGHLYMKFNKGAYLPYFDSINN